MTSSEAARPRRLAALLLFLCAPFALRAQTTDAAGEPTNVATHAVMMPALLGDHPHPREAGGTGWVPDSSPVAGVHFALGDWAAMAHGAFTQQYDRQSGLRGDTENFLGGMAMLMAGRETGALTLGGRFMLSPDPLMGARGYPLLLQTGETADGVTELRDRQHPHDLFMELAGTVSREIADGQRLFLYAGLPGEPALGPPAFMHRFSGEFFPAAPISHHWLDSTHVSFGVVTAGWNTESLQVEASAFNGREPDQNRWNVETGPLTSHALRVSWNPGRQWALQASWGRLRGPEQLSPDENVERTTLSAIRNWRTRNSFTQATFALGRNHVAGRSSRAALLESTSLLYDHHLLLLRGERIEKDELFPAGNPLARPWTVGALSAGYAWKFSAREHLAPALGAVYTRDFTPTALQAAYGREPHGLALFLRVRME